MCHLTTCTYADDGERERPEEEQGQADEEEGEEAARHKQGGQQREGAGPSPLDAVGVCGYRCGCVYETWGRMHTISPSIRSVRPLHAPPAEAPAHGQEEALVDASVDQAQQHRLDEPVVWWGACSWMCDYLMTARLQSSIHKYKYTYQSSTRSPPERATGLASRCVRKMSA